MSLVDTREIANAKIVMLGGTGGSNVEGNPTGSATAYLSKLQIDDTIYETAGVIPFDVTLINNSDIHISAVNAGQLDGKTILINTTTHTGTTSAGWFLKINQSTSYEMITPEGRSFKDAMSDNMAMIVRLDASQEEATVLGVLGSESSDVVSGLGIGKKTSVSNNVIITDIDLHRAPMAGDRLLIWFDASVQNPTGLTTYNNGTAVTSNLENVSPLSYNAGWNIVQFMNDGLLYNNVWVRKQNVPLPISTLSGLSDTAIASPSDGQLLTYDNDTQKWKNKTYVEANTGFPVTELKKLKVGNIVYDTDGMKNYSVTNVASNNITVSVLNSNQFVQEVIAINTGNHTGSSSAWNLVLNDGMNPVSVALKNADGSPFADDIHENELLFVYVDTAGNVATVLGTAGASNEVYSAFNLLSKSEVAESVPYLYRRSGGAVRDVALEHLKKVVGASVAWNQLVEHGDFDATTGWATDSATLSVANNIGTITPNGSAYSRIKRAVLFITGHKYLVSVEYKKTSALATIPIFSERLPDAIATDNASDGVGSFVKKTLISNCIDGTNNYLYVSDGRSSTSTDARYVKNAMCIDLTAMFGTAIADYLYSLEQATAGSGIAKLKEWGFFTKDYYAYNAGALQSVKTSGKKCVGKNLTEKVLQNVSINSSAALENNNAYNICIARIIQGKDYIVTTDDASGFVGGFFYDEPTIGSVAFDSTRHIAANKKFTAPITGYVVYRTTASYTTPQIEFGITATAYEPYTEKTYPLSNVELRGLFKLDSNNNLYADGDEYTPDGNVKRKYGIVDLGTLTWEYYSSSSMMQASLTNALSASSGIDAICARYTNAYASGWSGVGDKQYSIINGNIRIKDTSYTDAAAFKTAMSGIYLIYELATATTETTTPYNETMLVDGDGTEEFLDSRDIPVPVGHESGYNQAIKGLPTAPTADGNYKLRCTVTNGMPSFSWVSDT